MPRGKPNRYRINYKVWWGTGSMGSTQTRDLTQQEFVNRLREVAKELTEIASHEQQKINAGDAAQREGR